MYDQLVDREITERAVTALKEHGFEAEIVPTGSDALDRVRELIPAQASVMNGSSQTLEQIGYIQLLKSGDHPWNNLHTGIVAETDETKKAALRQQAIHADFYLGSVHAATEDGQLLIASNTGSQLPHLDFTSRHVILIVSTKKIVSDLNEAFRRLEETVVPLEDARMRAAMNVGTAVNKVLILKGENPHLGRQVHVLFVEEDLGY